VFPSRARRNEFKANFVKAMNKPKYVPPISKLIAGRDGSVWLQRETTGASTIRWSVLDPAGKPVGQISLPARSRLLEADLGRAWVAEEDELSIPYLVRYRVVH